MLRINFIICCNYSLKSISPPEDVITEQFEVEDYGKNRHIEAGCNWASTRRQVADIGKVKARTGPQSGMLGFKVECSDLQGDWAGHSGAPQRSPVIRVGPTQELKVMQLGDSWALSVTSMKLDCLGGAEGVSEWDRPIILRLVSIT